MVTITAYETNGSRPCVFCTRTGTRLYVCSFRDGLNGALCPSCFERALRLRKAEPKVVHASTETKAETSA